MGNGMTISTKKVIRRERAAVREAAETPVVLSIGTNRHYPVIGNLASTNGHLGEEFRSLGYCASSGQGTVELVGRIDDQRVWKYEGPRNELILDGDTRRIDVGYNVQEHDRHSPQYIRISKIITAADKSRPREPVLS